MLPLRKSLPLMPFVLLLGLCQFSDPAFATSASITLSGNEGEIHLDAHAAFSSYTFCNSEDPPDCRDDNSGRLRVYRGSRLLHSINGRGSTGWSTVIDGGLLPQGENVYSATAVDAKRISVTEKTAVFIDNTPEIHAQNPGTVEGAFNITGDASFKECIGGNDGTVYLYLDRYSPQYLKGYKSVEGTGVTWSYSEITGGELDAGAFSQGTHKLLALARSANGTKAWAEGTFTVDNTPEVTVQDRGPVEAMFDMNGSATFKEHVGGIEGTVYLYLDRYSPQYLKGHKSFEGTGITWSYSEITGGELDAGAFSQGDHKLLALARSANGTKAWAEGTFTVDNTPEITVQDRGPVEGGFDMNGSATFKEHVGGIEGTVYLYLDRYSTQYLKGHKSFEGTGITWSYSEITGGELDAGAFSQGTHKLLAQAKSANGTKAWAEGTFTVDNTPEITVQDRGPVEGGFDMNGSATFKEHVGGIEGTVYLYLDRYNTQYLKGHKSFEGTGITWSYSEITGDELDAGPMSQGDHKLLAQAKSANGTKTLAEGTFTVDNTPEISVQDRGPVEGGFDMNGSATFKEHVGGIEGTVYLYLDRYGPQYLKGHKSFEGTGITWSYSEISGDELDAGPMSQGGHRLLALAKSANGTKAWAEGTFTVDNTPEVSVQSPGPVEGEFDIEGGALFKEHVGGDEGRVYLYIDGQGSRFFRGSKSYNSTVVNWRYSEIVGTTLNADDFKKGKHTIHARARAVNGTWSDWATGTFIVKPCKLSLSSDKDSLLPGETALVTAQTENPPDTAIKWSWERKTGDVKVTLSPSKGNSVRITDVEGEGLLLVHAEYEGEPDCRDEIEIRVGCDSCENCDKAGRTKFATSSIHVRFSMGRTWNGRNAGFIVLYSDEAIPENATPELLKSRDFNNACENLYENGILRQVLSPEALANIRIVDEQKYVVDFHRPEDVDEKVNGLYKISGTAIPFVSWIVENPDAAAGRYERLRITESGNGITRINEYTRDAGENTWRMSLGNGLSVRTLHEEIIAGDRVVTETLVDSSGLTAEKTRTVHHPFPWGEEVVEETVDPDGASLTTVTAYIEDPSENGYGRIARRVLHDGSWVRYVYDSVGRRIKKIATWLNAPEGAPESESLVTAYDYSPVDMGDTDAAEDRRLPRTITESIMGIPVTRTYRLYRVDAVTRERTEIEERCAHPSAPFGAGRNLRTVSVTHPVSTGNPASGRVKEIRRPDGTMETRAYERGTFTPGADATSPGDFIPGHGTHLLETVIHGTTASPGGIAGRTTMEGTVLDDMGNTLLSATLVRTDDGYAPIHWIRSNFNRDGNPTRTVNSNGEIHESFWNCCSKTGETDARGTVRSYTHDDLGRVLTETRETVNGPLTTRYTRDATGRIRGRHTTGGGLSRESSATYDIAGRPVLVVDHFGRTTHYAYSIGGRATTVTRPGGFTEITSRHMDGRLQSLTGTSIIPRYHSYGIDPDGNRWTLATSGHKTSPMWERTVVDPLGRTVRIEKPGPAGTVDTVFREYDARGLLIRESGSAKADTVLDYDALGNLVREGLDLNGNGILDPASMDRIEEHQTHYAIIDGTYWKETVRKIYPESFSGEPVTVAVHRERLTGLTGGLTGETVSMDIHGNKTVSRTFTDRNTGTVTETVEHPDAEINAVSIWEHGLLISSQSKTGVKTTFDYDGLERRTHTTDPRTGPTVRGYDNMGLPAFDRDPAGFSTTYTHDPQTGRKLTETNAKGHTTRYEYNARGQVMRIWGDAVEPVSYLYDIYGRKIEMHTYQGGTGWENPEWPEGSTGPSAVTRWHYDEATGLLLHKGYDDGKGASYGYTNGGKLLIRTWARLKDGTPLTTVYSHDPGTGELTDIVYSDTHFNTTFTYDRLGRKETVADATAMRSFHYNETLQLESERISGFYQKVITRTYDDPALPGRPTGFSIGRDYRVTYGYGPATGRLDNILWNVDDKEHSVNYAYVPDSDLIHSVTTASGAKTTYTYEPLRNLKTEVKNEFNDSLISRYEYGYNEIGLRDYMETSGSAFDDKPHPPAAVTKTYKSNSLNQYTEITKSPGTPSVDRPKYDDDGNLTEMTGDSGKLQYEYNGENRLVLVQPVEPENGEKRVEFTYDYMGRRVRKKVFTWQEGAAWFTTDEKLFVFDEWNLTQEQTSPGGAKVYYLWGFDVSNKIHDAGGIGGQLSRTTSQENVTQSFFHDANGNVMQVINSHHGNIVAHYEYQPFGTLRYSYGILEKENPFNINSKYFSTFPHFYYYGHRFLSPKLGRWINRDPYEENGGINLYIFANNNPITNYDYLGLFVEKCSRWVGNPNSAATNKNNPIRHDFINISGSFIGFHPQESMLWSSGKITFGVETRKNCRLVCDDPNYDRYVRREILLNKPNYSVLAVNDDSLPHMMGARNCQSWVDEVLLNSQIDYLRLEECPKCFTK